MKRRKRLFTLVLGVIIVVHLVVISDRRTRHHGDFDVNREFGARVIAGEQLYDDGLCFNYMPIAAVYWAPLAMVPAAVSFVLRYVVALACLVFVMRAMTRMVGNENEQFSIHRASVVFLTILLAIHYLLRDLDDGGPNLILLGILTAGIYSAWKRHDYLSGTWFGLAIAIKMTPALFVGFFLWKRRWRLAAATTVATVFWIVLPALWMGPTSWWHHQAQWNRMAATVFSGTGDDARDDNELRVQNQTLQLAVERYLVKYPSGHPLRASVGPNLTILDIAPSTADRFAKLAVLAVLAACCWRGRASYTDAQDPAWLCETSGVLLLVLLLSPVTWLQHMVIAIPAIFLIVAENRAFGGLPRAAKVLLAVYVLFSILLNRELLGRENYLFLLSYHIHTTCMLILLGLLLWIRPTTHGVLRREE